MNTQLHNSENITSTKEDITFHIECFHVNSETWEIYDDNDYFSTLEGAQKRMNYLLAYNDWMTYSKVRIVKRHVQTSETAYKEINLTMRK